MLEGVNAAPAAEIPELRGTVVSPTDQVRHSPARGLHAVHDRRVAVQLLHALAGLRVPDADALVGRASVKLGAVVLPMHFQDSVAVAGHDAVVVALTVDLPKVDFLVEGASRQGPPVRREFATENLALVAGQKHCWCEQAALPIDVLNLDQLLLERGDELGPAGVAGALRVRFAAIGPRDGERHGGRREKAPRAGRTPRPAPPRAAARPGPGAKRA
mmetsp:Transcript_22343/g.64018  ORF Transcript_22343/g.64018 Transcript_22343/m.64018 type:complete len:216 (+) Transcript_22343:602-1249(+)